MATHLRYVCLSDLHLGAPDSTLTRLSDCGCPDFTQCSPVLATFAQALRQTVLDLCDGRTRSDLPTLVLLGDILDMGVSPLGQVSTVFAQFMRAMFPPGEPAAFSPVVMMVPGNHDHHLWRMAQDRIFLDALRGGEVPDDLVDHTDYERRPPGSRIESELLTLILRQQSGLAEASVHIAYPNLCLLAPQRNRGLLLHHGHYIDPLYRLMSTLTGILSPTLPMPSTLEEIERQNGAWVDFLWSDLGSAGATGREAFSIYEMMGNAGASHDYAQQLRDHIVDRITAQFGISGEFDVWNGIRLRQVVGAAIEATLTRTAQTQRNNFLDALSTQDYADLRWFLSGPLLADLQRAAARAKNEGGAALAPAADLHISLGYGHTHKPYQREVTAQGLKHPVAVYNTGGWVLDQPTLTCTQGASALFISESLDVGTLRLFNDPVNGTMAPVHVEGISPAADAGNALLDELARAVHLQAGPWTLFSEAVRVKLQDMAHHALHAQSDPQCPN